MNRNAEWGVVIRYMGRSCPICHEQFATAACGHTPQAVYEHEQGQTTPDRETAGGGL